LVKLTVTIITRNEAANVEAALQSVSWADEIVVVDSRSTDETVDIARRYATRVEIRDWPGYSAQKNYAATLASNDWILSIDADERVTPELAREIRELLNRGPDAPGYRMSRLTWYLGRWLHSTDWYPDHQLRLYDRRVGRWNGLRVHESVTVQGRPGLLRHHIEHYAYRDVSDHVTSIDHYTTLIAEQWLEEGRRTNVLAAAIHPAMAFLRNYILRGGFRDGTAGFMVSVLNSYYVFMKLLKLWELQRDASSGQRKPRRSADPGHWRKPITQRNPNADRQVTPAPRQPPSGPAGAGEPPAPARIPPVSTTDEGHLPTT
jgi:glycosyltransferase involved in cell wall biosynthesis